jgi:hypothetical protein
MSIPIQHLPVESDAMPKDDVAFVLRLPPELHSEMVRLAVEHDRSLNKETVAAVRDWIKRHAAEDGGGK